MNMSFGDVNLGGLGRVGGAPTQTQVDQQAKTTGAASAAQAQQDKMEKTQQKAAMKAVGKGVATKKVLDKAGVTKPGSVKKGR